MKEVWYIKLAGENKYWSGKSEYGWQYRWTDSINAADKFSSKEDVYMYIKYRLPVEDDQDYYNRFESKDRLEVCSYIEITE